MNKFAFSIIFILSIFILPKTNLAQLNCYSLQAPELAVDGMKKIAIMNFENRRDVYWRYSKTNDYGSVLADYMVGLLLEEHRGVYTEEGNKANKVDLTDLTLKKLKTQKNAAKYAKGTNFMDRYNTNVYTVVERSELDKVMAEQSLGVSGAVTDADAASVGKLLGLDVIVSGGYVVDVNTSFNGKTSSTGGVYAKKKVNMDVTMKIISIETGQILSMINKTVSQKRTASGKNQSTAASNLPSDDQLVRDCLREISRELVSHFAPTFVYQALEVEKPLTKGYKEEFKKAKELVKENDLSGAFITIKEVYDADPYDAAMAHNMGVLYEAVGNFEEAVAYHKASYEIDPTKEHKEAFERGLNSHEALKELGRLGMDISPYEFDKDAKERLSIVKIETKGKKSDRLAVYSEPSKGSKVVAKVPGETSFVKLSEEGGWFKIQLLGGKEGYINATFIK